MVSWLLLMVQLLPVLRVAGVGFSISKPNCVDHCGDVKIPYPFGIGADCYHNRSYEIICNTSFGSSKPFLRQFNLEVISISWSETYDSENIDTTDEVLTVSLPRTNFCESTGIEKIISYDLKGSPYQFLMSDNTLTMEACGSRAAMKNRTGEILALCDSICVGHDVNMIGTTGNGDGFCTASILANDKLDYFEIEVVGQQTNSNSCNASVAIASGDNVTFPTPLDIQWRAPSSEFCNYTSKDYCECEFPYEGNPYLPNGCQVVQGCQNCITHCDEYSDNDAGTYYPHCQSPQTHPRFKRASFRAFFIGGGAVLLALSSYWLYRFVKTRIEIKQKAKHFKRNGGLLLQQQQMASEDGIVETTKVFTVTELEKATDNFNDNRILGQGAQGMVYKGMLMDGKIVAIKTAKKVDESQVEQFINEVVVLSQINHRNVVKLLGCCLETEVPILVYEFIQNGTLYELIHDQGQEFHLNWKMRLQIAAESAEAVAYLHSSSSAPIYHRDIKSANILLDEKYRAKVSDFGTSKAINIDQTHVTTVVLGTYGYLDPEYFQSHQFNEKSDVYSFGVVLVELITGKKPICPTGNGGWVNLSTEFLTEMEEGFVLDMLDARIINEGNEDEFMAITEIARKCLNMNGKQRPNMKEVAIQLDGIRSSHIPIMKELGHVKSNQGVTKVIDADGDPFGNDVFSSEDDPPGCSIEVQPLTDTEYFTANVII